MTPRRAEGLAVSAIVLAGGRAARYGRDKLAEQLLGEPLLERVVRVAGSVADEVLVAGRQLGSTQPRVRSVPDPEPFGGPLLGLAAAFDRANRPRAIVVAGDMPGIVPAVLASMLGRLASDPGLDAVILGRDAGATPPVAPPQVLPMALDVERGRAAAQAAIDRGERSLRSLLDGLRCVELPAGAWRDLDPGGLTLLDVDTAADLERIGAALAD